MAFFFLALNAQQLMTLLGPRSSPLWGRGGGQREKKRVCAPKIDLQFRAPLISLIFFLRQNFPMWAGGLGSGGGAQAAIPPPPSRGLLPPFPVLKTRLPQYLRWRHMQHRARGVQIPTCVCACGGVERVQFCGCEWNHLPSARACTLRPPWRGVGSRSRHATSVRQGNWFSVATSPVPKATQ